MHGGEKDGARAKPRRDDGGGKFAAFRNRQACDESTEQERHANARRRKPWQRAAPGFDQHQSGKDERGGVFRLQASLRQRPA
jgi:hypothetical protein